MSVLSRPLLFPQARYDLEDFNLGLSALRTDSHFYTQRVLAATAFILQGFKIDQSFIGQPTADIDLTSATLINGDNSGDISWWTAPETPDPLTIPIGVGGLQGGRNYVELQVYAQAGTPLQRAFWDPTANSGAGVEFTQEVNTVTEMFVRVVVNQTGFTTGNPDLIQLAIIDLDGSLNIKGIQDKRRLMYRLASPDDVDSGFVWGSQTEPTTLLTFIVASGTAYTAGETVTFTSGATAKVYIGGTNNIQVYGFSTPNFAPGDIVTGSSSGGTATLQSYYESFTGADKDISSYRDLFAALETEIKAVKGTRFWFEQGSVASLQTLLSFVSALMVPITSGARFAWSGTALRLTDNQVSGQAASDVLAAIRIPGFGGSVYLARQDGTGGSASLTIPDGSVLWVELPDYGSSRTFSGQGPGSSNYRISAITDFAPSDKNFVVAYREGSKVLIAGNGELEPGEETEIGDGVSKEILAYIGAASETSIHPQYTSTPNSNLSNQFTTNDSLTQAISVNAANINDIADGLLTQYQEPLLVVSGAPADDNEVTGPIGTLTSVTIPLDSRDSDSVRSYRVGSGSLSVYLNGIQQIVGEDYNEVGTLGSASTEIETIFPLVVGDELQIRILGPQFIGTAGNDQPYFRNYITGQNGDDIPAGAIYNISTDRLQVWRNGLSMLRTLSVGDAIDRYAEDSNNAVSISTIANPDEVFAFINHEAPSPNVVLLTGLTGTVITVPTYTIGDGSLRVFRNGLLMSTDVGAPTDLLYSETSTTSITLDLAIGVSDVLKIYRAGAAPTWRHGLTGVTGTVLTIPGGDSYVIGNQKLLVFRNGLLMYNSGSLGAASERYSETSTTSITLDAAAVTGDFFEFIRI